MSVLDLHTLDIANVLDNMFAAEARPGAVLSLVTKTPEINVGNTEVLVTPGRTKGALVHEGGAKPATDRAIVKKPFTSVKLVYTQRITDEFLAWDKARQGNFVGRLVSDWTNNSLPLDIDTVVMHGLDPATGTQDTNLSDYMTKTGSHIAVPATGTTAAAYDADLNSAIAALNDYDANGLALTKDAATKLATVMNGNVQKYPGLGVFGLAGGRGNIAGIRAAANTEVAQGGVHMIAGDWSQLMLGFAGAATWKTIQYGDPDNTGRDLQGHNEVCIRMELGFGFRVLDANAFAIVK